MPGDPRVNAVLAEDGRNGEQGQWTVVRAPGWQRAAMLVAALTLLAPPQPGFSQVGPRAPVGPQPGRAALPEVADQATEPEAVRQPLSNAGEAIYAAARPRLLQIRTLVSANSNQSSIGSGFLVSRDGLAITNYHVVSQYALEPGAYRLQSIAADGSNSDVELLAIDVIHDLALVRLQNHPGQSSWFDFSTRAIKGDMPKGERLFAMGNPLDLGFTIVEGTYNGLVAKSYEERIHFSGAINPGMSGGPVVTADGRVVGINVAKRLGSDLVSFLVPAKYAAALVERARPADGKALSGMDVRQVRAEIARQLQGWQSGLFKALADRGLSAMTLGPYQVADAETPWMSCWAQTNAGQSPAPKAATSTTNCSIESQIFIAGNLTTGELEYRHTHVRTTALNPFQFANQLSGLYAPPYLPGTGGKRMTPQRCHEDVLNGNDRRPRQRVLLCSRAYRDFDGLYDFTMTSVTQDRTREALLSQLTLRGVAWVSGLSYIRRFMEATQWAQ